MIRVKATREGLLGQLTASGYVIDTHVPFVALPARRALGQFVRITNPSNGKSVLAVVLDIGPHFTHDEAYVFQGFRPAAETGKKEDGTRMNGAGIDLGEVVWNQLGMMDNSDVEWSFIA